MSKIQHFSACRGEEYFTALPHPSRRGDYSFIPVTRLPHRQVTTGPARPHQRPSGIKLAQHAQNTPKTAFFASRANFVSVSPRIHSCRASFISPKSSAPKPQQRCHGFHAPIVKPQHRRRRFHETPNRSAGSQQGAQMLMLAASTVALVASGQFDSKEMP